MAIHPEVNQSLQADKNNQNSTHSHFGGLLSRTWLIIIIIIIRPPRCTERRIERHRSRSMLEFPMGTWEEVKAIRGLLIIPRFGSDTETQCTRLLSPVWAEYWLLSLRTSARYIGTLMDKFYLYENFFFNLLIYFPNSSKRLNGINSNGDQSVSHERQSSLDTHSTTLRTKRNIQPIDLSWRFILASKWIELSPTFAFFFLSSALSLLTVF